MDLKFVPFGFRGGHPVSDLLEPYNCVKSVAAILEVTLSGNQAGPISIPLFAFACSVLASFAISFGLPRLELGTDLVFNQNCYPLAVSFRTPVDDGEIGLPELISDRALNALNLTRAIISFGSFNELMKKAWIDDELFVN